MPTHEISLQSGFLYHCRVVENYDPWKAISRALTAYDVEEMQLDAYRMFAAAMKHLPSTLNKHTTARVTATYECMNIVIAALYFMAKDKGVPVKAPPPEVNYHTAWPYKSCPEHMLAYFCRLGQPHQVREDLYILYQEVAGSMWRYLSKAKRKRLTKLFEYLTDLATAAHVIATQGVKTKSPA